MYRQRYIPSFCFYTFFLRSINLKITIPAIITAALDDSPKASNHTDFDLSNAVKYVGERGIIKVTLSAERKKISLSVYNTGQGIENEEKSKIFDRFYRVDKARSRQNGSYGLGLAIAKAIVDEHGGKISVDSEYGKWICFNVQL